jgi:hypothetical protein
VSDGKFLYAPRSSGPIYVDYGIFRSIYADDRIFRHQHRLDLRHALLFLTVTLANSWAKSHTKILGYIFEWFWLWGGGGGGDLVEP